MKKSADNKSVVVLDVQPVAETKAEKDDTFKIPAWMDCTWRRVPCGQLSCPICGRLAQARARHIARGEDPDDVEAVLSDVSENFSQTLQQLREDAKRLGIDVAAAVGPDDVLPEAPEPENFPLYRAVKNWNDCLGMILQTGRDSGAPWVITDVYADLSWYGNTLLAKTYRQLTSAWEREHTPEFFVAADVAYTQRVLGECCDVLARNLRELLPLSGAYFVPVSKLLSTLALLRGRLLAI